MSSVPGAQYGTACVCWLNPQCPASHSPTAVPDGPDRAPLTFYGRILPSINAGLNTNNASQVYVSLQIAAQYDVLVSPTQTLTSAALSTIVTNDVTQSTGAMTQLSLAMQRSALRVILALTLLDRMFYASHQLLSSRPCPPQTASASRKRSSLPGRSSACRRRRALRRRRAHRPACVVAGGRSAGTGTGTGPCRSL